MLIAKVFGATSSLAASAVGTAFGISSITSYNKPATDAPALPPAEGADDASDASITNNQKTVKLQQISPVVVTEETKNRVFFLKDHAS